MRMGTPRNAKKRGICVMSELPVRMKNPVKIDLPVLRGVASKASDRAWMIGDQAMRKADGEGPNSTQGGRFQ